MPEPKLAGLHPEVLSRAELALAWARYYGLHPEVTSGFRSLGEQARLRSLYDQGRTRYPVNRPGDSAHNYGLAWDSTVPPDELGAWTIIRRWVGFEVPDNDVVHAEVPGWRRFKP